MDSRDEPDPASPRVSLDRRAALKVLGGGGLAVGTGVAVNNVVLGYGTITGTNLLEQDLEPLARRGFRGSAGAFETAGYRVQVGRRYVVIHDLAGGRVGSFPIGDPPSRSSGEAPQSATAGGMAAELARDLRAIEEGALSFEFMPVTRFFDRVSAAIPRGYTTDVVRGLPRAAPDLTREFTRADPTDPEAVIVGLVDAFREHTRYDVPRYIAGSVQDNVLLGAADLRAPFESETSLDALLTEGPIGLFCYDYTDRSIEALHAVPAYDQSVPVVGARVYDRRHKHVYTGIASVVRDARDRLVVPMAFVDYTRTTLYDDLGLRRFFGNGLNAYDSRHRATAIYWR